MTFNRIATLTAAVVTAAIFAGLGGVAADHTRSTNASTAVAL
ncbi:hypothetical protein [Streptomyces sp. HUAS TT7]